MTKRLMGIKDADGQKDNGIKKKTLSQLQLLEKFYSEEKYPKQNKLEEYASLLNLTYNQVRIWFSERRRKERRACNGLNSSIKSFPIGGSFQASKCPNSHGGIPGTSSNEGRYNFLEKQMKSNKAGRINDTKKKHHLDLQIPFSKDYIMKKIFRKDGPPLGLEFDSLPGNSFAHCRDFQKLQQFHDRQQICKRSKADESFHLASRALYENNFPTGKYGVGKGLMTVWRATQNCTDRSTWMNLRSKASNKAAASHVPRELSQRGLHVTHNSQKMCQDKRKKVRKVPSKKDVKQKEPNLTDCKLSLDESPEQSSELMTLVDDEELELEELEAGPNPLRCSAHLASNGNHCPLCKNLLARFPPDIVKMKQLFSTRPWDSSPELVKRFFKVLQFIYSHSATIDVCPFTVDEFAQAFHDKDSLLLGKVHVGLLSHLMVDAEKEITSGFTPRASKICRFLVFLNFIREENFDINHWRQSLTPLTWVEILRHVLIAAGFGAKHTPRRENNKERNQMEKYGLHHHTLKGELFSLLSKQGSPGLTISELAKDSQIAKLCLPNTVEELEQLIYSTLSSDITLFEKIAPSAYRLRVDPRIKGKSDSQSDTEDSGSVDDESNADESCSSDDSEVDSCFHDRLIVKSKVQNKKTNQKLAEYTEIDESYSGEAWMQGLMEGEYSNLSIEEKLDALIALTDLVGACSSLRKEEPATVVSAIKNVKYHGSGAKIKKASANMNGIEEGHSSLIFPPADPSACPASCSVAINSANSSSNKRGCQSSSSGTGNSPVKEACKYVHPMQSILLGSDRRYNNYWLFLGPCTAHDPGHRRVYFESSEDGHWEVIDTAQVLHALLSILDSRGTREVHLISSLEKRKSFLCQAMDDYMVAAISGRQTKSCEPSDVDATTSGDGSSPISDIDNVPISAESDNLLVYSCAINLEIGKSTEEKQQKWDRLQSYDKWIWNSFYSTLNSVKYGRRSYMETLAHCEHCHDLYWRDEKHCKTCHTTFELDFDLDERYAVHRATCREPEDVGEFPNHKVLPSQLQVLKASVHAIESSMPEAALAGTWRASAHKLWVKRLRRASSLPEILQVLTDFVGAINADWLSGCLDLAAADSAADDVIIQFQTMPQTTSAVALWIFKLDTLIAPHLQKVQSERSSTPAPQLKRRRTCTSS